MGYREQYEYWCSSPYFDEGTRKELMEIKENAPEIEERFYKELSFGTGGLRGILGAGTNRMNIYTVRKATQGLANFIVKEKGQKRGVVIAFDSRNMSVEFAREAAGVFCANGIVTYLFEELRPTPELSFAVRELGCIAGVVITASHNPAEYNGYKVYWEDGAQITAPKDREIIAEIHAVQKYSEAQIMSQAEAVESGLLKMIGKEIDDKYIKQIKNQILDMDVIHEMSEKLKIVYTPLHGSGNKPVQRILKELGFKNVYIVPQQEFPDGNFPTVPYPNPEDAAAFEMALELAEQKDADIVLATDPDADRLGVYVKDSVSGTYIPFTGNMSGLLIAEYELSRRKEKGILPQNGAIVTTIVSSGMAEAMAEHYGITRIEVLTGFKYIGEQIKEFEENHSYEFLFGYEESYGCLLGTYARDKDAVVAVAALCEAAAYYMQAGKTLWDQMCSIYEHYGYYKEDLISMTKKGIHGVQEIQAIMKNLRENPPEKLGSENVTAVRDYSKQIRKDCRTNQSEKMYLPKADVLYFEMENHGWCCVRPSGTEPKVKIYVGVCAAKQKEAQQKLEDVKRSVMGLVE